LRESTTNTEIVNSIKAAGHWAYKIPDFPQSMIAGSRFNPEKPFDIVAFIAGRAVAIEGKQFKKYQAFGERHMRPSQLEEFNRIVDRDAGRAFVFLNIRQPRPRLNRLLIFDWKNLRERFKDGSIKMRELEAQQYLEGRKKLFNLGGFFLSIDRGCPWKW